MPERESVEDFLHAFLCARCYNGRDTQFIAEPDPMPSSPVVLGLWPLAGITTVGVTQTDAKETMVAAIENGISKFDTAFSYGYEGESDRLLGEFIRPQRDQFTVIGKVGQRWTSDRQRIVDGSAKTLIADAQESLRRIGIEQFDVPMLHSPDPNVPLERSAETMDGLRRRGLCQRIGVCNVDLDQYRQFATAVPCAAIECPLNLLQRGASEELIPLCQQDQCEVYVFWVLMKGLLAGRISRDHVFAEGDSRPGYDIYRGEARSRTHDILDKMQAIADATGRTIAQLSIGWALSQNGVTAPLVGARRADQVAEIANARALESDVVAEIERIVALK